MARGGGVSVIRRAFPDVKIVCGAVDDSMKEGWLEGYKGEGNPEGLGRKVWVMQPGMGQIGTAVHSCILASLIIVIIRGPLLSVMLGVESSAGYCYGQQHYVSLRTRRTTSIEDTLFGTLPRMTCIIYFSHPMARDLESRC